MQSTVKLWPCNQGVKGSNGVFSGFDWLTAWVGEASVEKSLTEPVRNNVVSARQRDADINGFVAVREYQILMTDLTEPHGNASHAVIKLTFPQW